MSQSGTKQFGTIAHVGMPNACETQVSLATQNSMLMKFMSARCWQSFLPVGTLGNSMRCSLHARSMRSQVL